ncbi:glycosyltransferase family 4 protein [Ammoniphilus sp. 3BR4]
MKILYLVHQFYPEHYRGTEKFVLNMASMMQKMGHQVTVLTHGSYDFSFYDQQMENVYYKEMMYKGIPVIVFRMKRNSKKLNHNLGNESLKIFAGKILEYIKPDLIHVGHSKRVAEFITVAKTLRIPYIITLTDFFLMCPKGVLLNSKRELCDGPRCGHQCRYSCPQFSQEWVTDRYAKGKDILCGAHKVFAPSRFVAGKFNEEFPGLKVKVINHGIKYSTIKMNNRIYKENDSLVFCYAGGLKNHKGVHLLIDAFLKLKFKNVQLKIFGSGCESYLKKLKSKSGDDPRIEFCGIFEEQHVGEVLSGVDAVILPSLWYENYPLILHEAVACRLPVICSDAGGMSEKIKDGWNGFTFPVGDKKKLRSIIEKVTRDATILNELKKNLSSSLIPSIEQEAYAYEKEYRRILVW